MDWTFFCTFLFAIFALSVLALMYVVRKKYGKYSPDVLSSLKITNVLEYAIPLVICIFLYLISGKVDGELGRFLRISKPSFIVIGLCSWFVLYFLLKVRPVAKADKTA
ncbi:MAG: hypothetical protein KRP56_03680 [Candidatus Methanogranum gryphiswaldense]|nr:MAG: hypothetical protein KRP56_03680 [Candidatus Methanogranum sp. U3.2.1]